MTTQPLLDFSVFSHGPLLDGHVHLWPAVQPEALWAVLQATGAARCNAVAVAALADQPLNETVWRFKAASQGRAYAFGALDYSAHFAGGTLEPDDLAAQACALWQRGFDGIKMVEGKTAVYPSLPGRFDSPFFEPFFAWMEEQGVPILLHVADPQRLWEADRVGVERWSYAGGGFPSRQEQYAELERLLGRHPRLRLILAHFLFLWDDLPAAAAFLEAHPSAALDLAPGVEGYLMLSRTAAQAGEFLRRYQERIIYGTDMGAGPLLDSPAQAPLPREAARAWLVRAFLETDWTLPMPSGAGWGADPFAGQLLQGLALPPPTLERLYRLNFEEWVGAAPRPLA
ncbi:MAG: amidohydrolase family protein [Chloroflexi bacterium]|nr:amidohydrolase family protein [Chloroflexota bacterium]